MFSQTWNNTKYFTVAGLRQLVRTTDGILWISMISVLAIYNDDIECKCCCGIQGYNNIDFARNLSVYFFIENLRVLFTTYFSVLHNLH